MNPTDVLRKVCAMVSAGETDAAEAPLKLAFPPLPTGTQRTTWPKVRLVRAFITHGFTDRYFGEPLVFPGTLRALSILAPRLFPYHRNWKQSETHPAYWLHYPTIDHRQPLARGGGNEDENIVITSMLHNAAKGNWLPAELGWRDGDAPLLQNWDGLLPWFLAEYDRNELLRLEPAMQSWHRAVSAA